MGEKEGGFAGRGGANDRGVLGVVRFIRSFVCALFGSRDCSPSREVSRFRWRGLLSSLRGKGLISSPCVGADVGGVGNQLSGDRPSGMASDRGCDCAVVVFSEKVPVEPTAQRSRLATPYFPGVRLRWAVATTNPCPPFSQQFFKLRVRFHQTLPT